MMATCAPLSMAWAAASAAKTRITLIGAGVNAVLAVGKVLGGVFGQSQALIVDGVHSASDLASDALVLWAARMGSLGPDGNHPYGHARFETAATLGIGAILLLVAGGFAYDALERLLQADTIEPPGMLALAVAGAGLSGCNTVRGVGQDIQSTGQAIERTSY